MVILAKSFIFILIFIVGFYLTYNQVFNGFPSDISAHIVHAQQFAPGDIVEVSYPMWHLFVYELHNVFNIPIFQSAVIINALVIMIWAMTIFIIVKLLLKEELSHFSKKNKEYLYLLMTVILMIMTAIYIPFFNKNLYIGQANCGVWHNVTLLMVKPFALVSLFTIVKYFETNQFKWMFSSIFVILLSIYAKPSFIIAFLPALSIFFLLFMMRKMKYNILDFFSNIISVFKRFKQEIIFLIIIAFLSVLILWGQYTSTYTGVGTQNKIIFDFLGVWSLYTPNIFISLLLTYLFPITVLFFINHKKSNTYQLSLVLTIVSVLLFACFAEEGQRYEHGNFGWSQQIAVQMFFIMSLVEYAKNYFKLVKWKRYILSITLLLHIISGTYYLIKILKGLSYA